ncbi:hypothetical protein JOD67_003185 [Tenggerimyces flavus]|nr:hypothetical protein [Tenggerimyces flavus]
MPSSTRLIESYSTGLVVAFDGRPLYGRTNASVVPTGRDARSRSGTQVSATVGRFDGTCTNGSAALARWYKTARSTRSWPPVSSPVADGT